jgi:hypothetical protein
MIESRRNVHVKVKEFALRNLSVLVLVDLLGQLIKNLLLGYRAISICFRTLNIVCIYEVLH